MSALSPAAHTIPEGEDLIPQAGQAPRRASASSALRQKSVWASLIAVVIAILWTIPTVGLLITSLPAARRHPAHRLVDGVADPNFTLDNYRQALFGGTTNLAELLHQLLRHHDPGRDHPDHAGLLAAYAFAWIDFKGRNFLFVAVFALQIVPIQVTLVPLLTLYVQCGPGGHVLDGVARRTRSSGCRWRSSCCTTS